MRLFIALDLDDSIREKIIRFMDGIRGFAPDARWVRPESLHVTLKFIGQWPDERLAELRDSLHSIHTDAFEVGFGEYGFFPTAKAPRVFWIGIHSGPQLASLATAIDTRLSSLGIAPEEHEFSPHLTLARRTGGSGNPRKNKTDHSNQSFARLQEKLAAMSKLDFGSMTAGQFFLYQSELSPRGSQYTKLSAFPLT
jgi:RNA 2',3'-cyclic 3'-phosphodiesterase